MLHALEAGSITPPLARFVAEVTTARCAVYTSFGWGAAAGRLPYLPRVRSGQAVLSPARWLLAGSDLPAVTALTAPGGRRSCTPGGRGGTPTAVVLCEGELCLPLDLDHRLHRAMLRARLGRAHQVELREAPSPATWPGSAAPTSSCYRCGWPAPGPNRTWQPPTPPRPVARNAGDLPGISAWLHAEIPGHPGRQDRMTRRPFAHLFEGWGVWPAAVVVLPPPRDDPPRRRTAPQPLPAPGHARLSTGLPPHGLAGGPCLRERGLVPGLRLATYHPETARFGHSDAMAAAEEVFAADSAAALAQITTATRTGIPAGAGGRQPRHLASSFAPTPTQGLRWLIDVLPHEPARPERSVRDATLELADPVRRPAGIVRPARRGERGGSLGPAAPRWRPTVPASPGS